MFKNNNPKDAKEYSDRRVANNVLRRDFADIPTRKGWEYLSLHAEDLNMRRYAEQVLKGEVEL